MFVSHNWDIPEKLLRICLLVDGYFFSTLPLVLANVMFIVAKEMVAREVQRTVTSVKGKD